MNNSDQRMFLAAVEALAEISKELEIPDDEAATANGNELILDAIEARQQAIENLLARIHRDGGHYIAMHGMEKALADADAKIVAWLARDDAEGNQP